MWQGNVYHYNDIITMYHYNVKSCAKVLLSMKAESTLLTKAVPQLWIHIHEPWHQENHTHLISISKYKAVNTVDSP